MKKLTFILFFSACFLGANAQVGNQSSTWNLLGNAGISSRNFLGTTDSMPLIFKTNGIERMRLATNKSYLGIGTTSPEAPLHIQIDPMNLQKIIPIPLLKITSPNGSNVFDITALLGRINIIQREPADLSIFGYKSQLTFESDGNIVVALPSNAKFNVWGSFCSESVNIKNYLTTKGFDISYTNHNLFLKQQEQGNFYIEGLGGGLTISPDGNIGVGKVPLQAKLDVNGSFKAQSANISDILTANVLNSQDAAISGTIDAQNANISGTLTTNHFSLTGNLGLGTSSPQEKLHIKGENLLITQAKNPTAGFQKSALIFDMVAPSIPVNPPPGKWGIEYVNSAAEGKGLNFWKYYYKEGGTPDDDSDRGWVYRSMIFLSSQESNNVGVGTISPQAKLDVNGSLKAQSANITGNLTANSATIPTLTTTTLNISGITLDNLTVNALTAQTATVTGNSTLKGTVTVGTVSQAANLDVINGALSAKSASIAGAFSAQSANITGSGSFGGAVTVGTTPQPANLDVTGALSAKSASIAGILKTKEVQVTLSGWPDYVFDKNYKLPTLNEVERFINENSHLPNVPSAAEVEANGLNIGEMNAILIQKVEELTLYILDLQKQINELKNR